MSLLSLLQLDVREFEKNYFMDSLDSIPLNDGCFLSLIYLEFEKLLQPSKMECYHLCHKSKWPQLMGFSFIWEKPSPIATKFIITISDRPKSIETEPVSALV